MKYGFQASARTRHRGDHLPRTLLGTCFLALGLAGCSSTSVDVRGGNFPPPLIPSLPMTIGVHFPEEFKNYRLEETVPQRGDWSIDIGEAQVRMLRAVLPAMFDRIEELETLEAATAHRGLSAVLVPEVKEMQFAIPFQTRSNFFEVWIRYEMSLVEPTGEVIARWPVTAYGKTRDVMLESAEAAVREASIMALRDAGAFLAIGFRDQQALQPWLERERVAADRRSTGE